MNIKQETGLRAKLMISAAALCIVLAASTYTVSAANYDKAVRFQHVETDDSVTRSVWKRDGTTLVDDNGARFAIESDTRRPLTAEEGLQLDTLAATPPPPVETPVAPSQPALPTEPIRTAEPGMQQPAPPRLVTAPPSPNPISGQIVESMNHADSTKMIWIKDGATLDEQSGERFIREIEIAHAMSPREVRRFETEVMTKSEIDDKRHAVQKKREKARIKANKEREKVRIKREIERAKRNQERARLDAEREALRLERTQRHAQRNQERQQRQYARNKSTKVTDTDVMSSDFPKPTLQEDQSGNRRYAH